MESLSFIPMTLASVLASFSADNANIEEAVISTHVSPEIAGLWELDLQAKPDFALSSSKMKTGNNKGNAKDEVLENLILAIEESRRLAFEAETAADEADKMMTASVEDTASTTANESNLSAQTANQCRERYNFGADNVVLTTSGDEWTYGKYVYHHQEEGLPIIAISTVYDNNEPDCSGMQINQKGEAMMAYVDYQPEKNKMRWCIDNEAQNCFLTFKQLLP